MKRSDFLKLLGLSAVSGAIISNCTFTSEEVKPNTVGYFISLLPIEHREYISGRYKEYFGNHCESMYYAMGMLTDKMHSSYWNKRGTNDYTIVANPYSNDYYYLHDLHRAYYDSIGGKYEARWPSIPSITEN